MLLTALVAVATLQLAVLVAPLTPQGTGTVLGGDDGPDVAGWSWTPPGSCPHYCSCYSWRGLRRADCVGRRLANVDLGLPKDAEAVDLSGNVISVLEDGCFQELGLVRLKELNLRHNAIHTVGPWAFAGLRGLSALDLSYNHLQGLHPDTFAGNRDLKVLLLAGNNLARLPADRPLIVAPRLQVLDLGSCKLAHLGAAILSELPALASLNLSANHLIQLQPQALTHLPQLQMLDASRNPLECDLNVQRQLQDLAVLNVTVRHPCPAPKHLARLLADVMPEQGPSRDAQDDAPKLGGGRAGRGRTHESLEDLTELHSLLGLAWSESSEEDSRYFEEVESSSEEPQSQTTGSVPRRDCGPLFGERNSKNPVIFREWFDPIPSFWSCIFGFQVGFVVALLVSCACRPSLWRSVLKSRRGRARSRARRARNLRAGTGVCPSASAPLWVGVVGADYEEADCESQRHGDEHRRSETPPPAYSELVPAIPDSGRPCL